MATKLTHEQLRHLTRVELVLARIFGINNASELIRKLAEKLGQLPSDAVDLIEHDDPYSIAVLIGGDEAARQDSDDAFNRYLEFVKSEEWRRAISKFDQTERALAKRVNRAKMIARVAKAYVGHNKMTAGELPILLNAIVRTRLGGSVPTSEPMEEVGSRENRGTKSKTSVQNGGKKTVHAKRHLGRGVGTERHSGKRRALVSRSPRKTGKTRSKN